MMKFLSIISFFMIASSSMVQAESVPSPQALSLSKYQMLTSENYTYTEQLDMAEKVINKTPSEFFTCYAHSDCVTTLDACGGTVAVSYPAKNYYDEAASLYGAVIDCILVQEQQNYSAACEESLCVLKTDTP